MMTTPLWVDEVRERLGALDLARPVLRREEVETHITAFLHSVMRSSFRRQPKIVWLKSLNYARRRLAAHGVSDKSASESVYIDRRVESLALMRPLAPTGSVQDNYRVLMSNVFPRRNQPSSFLQSVSSGLLLDDHYLKAVEAGFGYFSLRRNALVLIPRPALKTRVEHTAQGLRLRPVLHSTIGPAVQFAEEKEGDQYWLRGVRVPDFAVEQPEKITINDIRAAHTRQLQQMLIDQYGLLRWATENRFRQIDYSSAFGATLYARGGHRSRDGNPVPRQCIVELVNSTPEPDGTYRHFARRVPPDMQMAHQAVAWTFGFWPNWTEYKPSVQA